MRRAPFLVSVQGEERPPYHPALRSSLSVRGMFSPQGCHPRSGPPAGAASCRGKCAARIGCMRPATVLEVGQIRSGSDETANCARIRNIHRSAAVWLENSWLRENIDGRRKSRRGSTRHNWRRREYLPQMQGDWEDRWRNLLGLCRNGQDYGANRRCLRITNRLGSRIGAPGCQRIRPGRGAPGFRNGQLLAGG